MTFAIVAGKEELMFEIREMKKFDWKRVMCIYQQGIDTNVATFETACSSYEIFDTSHICNCRFIITDNDIVVGWTALSPVSNRCVYGGVAEVSIYIEENCKGKGAGTHLLTHMIEKCEEEGYWTLQAGIMQSNLASILLHEKCNFRMVGFREKNWERPLWAVAEYCFDGI